MKHQPIDFFDYCNIKENMRWIEEIIAVQLAERDGLDVAFLIDAVEEEAQKDNVELIGGNDPEAVEEFFVDVYDEML